MNLKIGNLYETFIESFMDYEKKEIDLDDNLISKEIFFHLFKIKLVQWKMKIKFKRLKRHSISNLFQDIIAYYLNVCLSEEYHIILEEKRDKIQPDIIVYKLDKPHFVIEIKTTIGWDRNGPKESFPKRIKEIASLFSIPMENVIYIFQNPYNVNKSFLERYINTLTKKPKPRPLEFPYSQIYPLFSGEDPFYWTHKDINRNEKYKEFEDTEILKISKDLIVTRFEEILSLIINK